MRPAVPNAGAAFLHAKTAVSVHGRQPFQLYQAASSFLS